MAMQTSMSQLTSSEKKHIRLGTKFVLNSGQTSSLLTTSMLLCTNQAISTVSVQSHTNRNHPPQFTFFICAQFYKLDILQAYKLPYCT